MYRNKFQFLLFHVVYKYCYSNSYLTKIYVEESVTDIMKHPVHGVSVRSASCETIAGVLVFQSFTIMRNVIAHSILVQSEFC